MNEEIIFKTKRRKLKEDETRLKFDIIFSCSSDEDKNIRETAARLIEAIKDRARNHKIF